MPVVVAGGSLSVSVSSDTDWVFEGDNVVSHPYQLGYYLRSVEFWDGARSYGVVKHNTAAEWKLIVHYVNPQGVDRPVTFYTDMGGQKLQITSDNNEKTQHFRKVGGKFIKHHKNKWDVASIEFDRGTSTSPGCPNYANKKCPCANGDCGIILHYCKTTYQLGVCAP